MGKTIMTKKINDNKTLFQSFPNKLDVDLFLIGK